MTKSVNIPDEVLEIIRETARASANEACRLLNGTRVDYFKAMEKLLYNYRRLATLVADEEAYCHVEYHAGRRSMAAGAKPTGYFEHKTEADIIDEMREERKRQYDETKYGFDRLQRIITLFKSRKEFIVIRMYYFGEDRYGYIRASGPYTWEELAYELEEAGILTSVRTACRWRNRIVNDMAVCMFGTSAAVSAATYHQKQD